jgi:Holliday junction resolvase RusA-like endonuclease
MPKLKHFVIKGKLLGFNQYDTKNKRSRYAAGQAKKNMQELIAFSAFQSWKRPRKIHDKKIFVTFRWYEKDRRRDKDNIAFAKKFIFDALQEIKAIKNDNWDCVSGFQDLFFVDSKNPRIEVDIKEIQNDKTV